MAFPYHCFGALSCFGREPLLEIRGTWMPPFECDRLLLSSAQPNCCYVELLLSVPQALPGSGFLNLFPS